MNNLIGQLLSWNNSREQYIAANRKKTEVAQMGFHISNHYILITMNCATCFRFPFAKNRIQVGSLTSKITWRPDGPDYIGLSLSSSELLKEADRRLGRTLCHIQDTSANCLSQALLFTILFVCPSATACLSVHFSFQLLVLGKATHFNIKAKLYLPG